MMNLRHKLARLVPESLASQVRVQRERVRLMTVRTVPAVTAPLSKEITAATVAGLFDDTELAAEWAVVVAELAALGITERADGINVGDRRALYYLVRRLQPHAVLEIGTHIGASTIHIAAALRNTGTSARLTTVDVADVNDEHGKPWLAYGARMSPRTLVSAIGMSDAVEFVTRPSLDYIAATRDQFDFIFLDGDHSAPTVYREIPAALRLLRPGGVILLHDYFPGLAPLWPDGRVLPGSWMAVSRLRSEGAALDALPLGDLPWPTKQGTRRTSLALLVAH